MFDPITAGLQLANSFIILATKIYEDTPLPVRQQHIERWVNILAAADRFLTTGKL
jgi:hypothetical protein